jgi:hypothetical protein
MNKIKMVLRHLVLVILIILAGFGIGLSGGVPIPFQNNKRDPEMAASELVEGKEEETDVEKEIK